MSTEAELLAELVGILKGMLRPGDTAVHHLVTWRLGALREGETRAYTANGGVEAPEGRHDRVVPPREFYLAMAQLPAAMARPGRGTWFSADIRVSADGEVTTAFDYDTEPAWRSVAPASLAAELEEFPRDPEHRPAWLVDRLAGIPGPPRRDPVVTDPATSDGRAEMPAARWRTLTAEVTPRFVAQLDLEGARVPTGARAFVKLPKDFSLTRSATHGGEAAQVLKTLAIYGETAQAARAAAEFGAFPITTHRVPEPSLWQTAVHAVWYFSRRHGDAESAALLDGLLELAPRARLSPAYFDGRILRDPLDGPEGRLATSPRLRASSYILQLGTLASMWAYGGGGPYPRDRIDAEVERYLAALYAEPGFAPTSEG